MRASDFLDAPDSSQDGKGSAAAFLDSPDEAQHGDIVNALTGIPDLATAALAYGMDKAGNAVGLLDKTNSFKSYVKERPFANALETTYQNPVDAISSVASGAVRTTPQMIDSLGALGAKGLNYAASRSGWMNDVPLSDYAKEQPLNNLLSSVIGQEYKPQTEGGNVLKFLGGLEGPSGYVSGAKAAIKGASKLAEPAEDLLKAAANPESVQAAIQAAKEAPRTAQDFKSIAQGLYEKADASGGVISPDVASGFLDKIKAVTPQSAWGKAAVGDNPVNLLQSRLESMRGSAMSLKDAQELDSELGDMAYSTVDKTGKMTAEGKKYLDMQSQLRDTIATASEADVAGGKEGFDALSAARDAWHKQAQLNDVERIVQRASMTDNPATSIRTGMRNLVMSGRIKDPLVLSAAKKAADTGVVGDALRVLGSRLTSVIATAAHGGGPVGSLAAGGIAHTGGALARSGMTALQEARAQAVMDAIAKVPEMPNAIQRIGASIGNALNSSNGGIRSQSGAASPKLLVAGGVLGGGLGAANFASSLATNTSYNPATPSNDVMPDRNTGNAIDAAQRLDAAENGVPDKPAPEDTLDSMDSKVTPQETKNPLEVFADKVIQAESNGKANAKAKTSSAYGAAQFTKGTWLQMVNKYLPDVSSTMSKREILDLRANPDVAKKVTMAFGVDNAKHLIAHGAPINEGSLYLAHFAGPSVAARILTANPNTPVSRFFSPEAIRANASVLKGKRVGDLVDWANKKMGG